MPGVECCQATKVDWKILKVISNYGDNLRRNMEACLTMSCLVTCVETSTSHHIWVLHSIFSYILMSLCTLSVLAQFMCCVVPFA